MRRILDEHNTLNGFRFVLAEFIVVALAALFIGAATFRNGSILWTVVWIGVAVNAAAVCVTVVGQMRRGKRSNSFAESYSREGREKIRREHPNLGAHTLLIMGLVLIPFLLAMLTIPDRPAKPGAADPGASPDWGRQTGSARQEDDKGSPDR